jgi:hypothetical protein
VSTDNGASNNTCIVACSRSSRNVLSKPLPSIERSDALSNERDLLIAAFKRIGLDIQNILRDIQEVTHASRLKAVF